jgi:uncharacterized membrane protein YgdD (TMEM256/DUF423 family)
MAYPNPKVKAMNPWLLVGAVSGFLGVAAGAFGVHGLAGRVDAQALSIFQTGAQYHLIHALATVLAALAARGARARLANVAAALFTAGVVLFSGSLYFLVLAHSDALVLATPVGGLAFLAGWAALAVSALRPDI